MDDGDDDDFKDFDEFKDTGDGLDVSLELSEELFEIGRDGWLLVLIAKIGFEYILFAAALARDDDAFLEFSFPYSIKIVTKRKNE